MVDYTPLSERRFFTDAYDYSPHRKGNVTDHARDSAFNTLARFRLDALLNGKIVFTDAQFFHTPFLNGIGDQYISNGTLIDSLPYQSLEIRCRKKNLEDSLVALIRTGNEYLSPHLFTFIDPSNFLKNQLASIPANRVSTWRDIPVILKELADGDSEIVGRIEKSEYTWAKLIEAEKKGILTTVVWSDFNFPEYLEHFTLKNLVRFSPETELGKYWKNELLFGTGKRADLAADTLENDENIDLVSLDEFFSEATNQTIAVQHNCPFVERSHYLKNFANPTKVFHDQMWRPKEVIHIPDYFLYELAAISSNSFNILKDDLSGNLGLFYHEGNEERGKQALVNLVEKLKSNATGAKKEAWSPNGYVRTLTIGSGAALLTFAATLPKNINENLSNLAISAAAGLAAILPSIIGTEENPTLICQLEKKLNYSANANKPEFLADWDK
ncbi:hypothetical protein [Thalassospira tepidiphila]|uniref:hypothetical protein n=1 Tax=Thalassospira tepidiphila TaxID=393657 RepID=UPI003AA9DBE6